MDYLLSLVGKDQDTIIDAIKELAKHADKVKIQEEKINDQQSELEDNKEVIDDRDRLLKEIPHIEKENKDKVELLENIEKEKATLKEKLEKVETENIELKDCAKIAQKIIQLSLELSLVKEFINKFECNSCGKEFENKRELKMYIRKIDDLAKWKLKIVNGEKEVIGLKYKISSGIHKLKEIEFNEKQTCQCIGWCAINHEQHSWKETRS